VSSNVRVSVIGIDASRAISSEPTGTEGYSYHLIRALIPLLSARHAVRLYLRSEPLRAPTSDGAYAWWGDAEAKSPTLGAKSPTLGARPNVRVRIIPFPRLWTHVRLSWEMLRHPPALLFVPAHVLPLAHPRRTLVTVHDLGYLAFPEAHPPRQRLYLDLSTRWNVRVATHVLADSEATRTAIADAYGTRLEKITVVYPGYAPDPPGSHDPLGSPELTPVQDQEQLERVRRQYGIPGAYILYLGRIQPRKNLVRLVEAFAGIAARHPALTLVIAGPTGWLVDPITARVQALGLDGRVRFPGYIAAEDKSALISGARLFAYPSLYEGFGFPVLEAQACGTPLLTSTTSSLPEVAGDGGLLVDPEDVAAISEGLIRLLEDAELRDQLVARGFENLTRFSWTRAAQQTAAVIESLLAA
jgi:glycosyltransferase involved in cell wall biosynthesis